VQADHVAFGIDHEGNVAVLANQRESTSPNPQPREQTLADGPGHVREATPAGTCHGSG